MQTVVKGTTSQAFDVDVGQTVTVTPGSGGSMLVEYTTDGEVAIRNNSATWQAWTAGTVSAVTSDVCMYPLFARVTAYTVAGSYEVKGSGKQDTLSNFVVWKSDVASPRNADSAGALVGAAGFKVAVPVRGPIDNLDVVVGAAGALTGSYGYTYTFVLDDGTETEPWPGTAQVVTPSSQRVNVSSIAVADSTRVVARRLYRTVASPVDVKDYFFLVEISDNTTTTYVDNIADGSLGAPVNWLGTASGTIVNEEGRVAAGLGPQQSVAIGYETNAGYASTSIGFQAGRDVTSGRRNTLVGTYAGERITTGYQNTLMGVHAGGGITTSIGNTLYGYAAGGVAKSMTGFNCFFGQEVGANTVTATLGQQLVGVGYRALYSINTADNVVGIGPFAGAYANASRQMFIDVTDRTNIANAQNIGLIYGKGEGTAIAQVLHLNAPTRIGPPSVTVATLPAAAAGYTGFRAFVTDANATTFASIVAGGGSNGVPVYCDGANWRIG